MTNLIARTRANGGLPPDATFEAMLAGGVALYDVSHLLVQHDPAKRQVRNIRRIYVHHSGALGRAGFEGAYNSVRYVLYQREPRFPSAAYHFWVPFEDLYDADDNLVVLRLVSDDIRAWHTGGNANAHGLGVVLQGNTSTTELSHSHIECMQALLPWLRYDRGLQLHDEWLSWHADSGRFGGSVKAACPGRHAVEWLEAYRERARS